MSADETTRLRALLERATQTPWRQDGAEITVVGSTLGVGGGETVIAECTLPDCIEVADEDREEQEERNAALIVAAVNALPGLLDAAEWAERELATATASVRQLRADVELATAQRDAEACRADNAEAERDDLAATLETRVAVHALAMARVAELEALVAQRVAAITERDVLREVIAGRDTWPTHADLIAHEAAGGRWLVHDEFGKDSIRDSFDARMGLPRAVRLIALDAEGRPCAWPTAEVSRG